MWDLPVWGGRNAVRWVSGHVEWGLSRMLQGADRLHNKRGVGPQSTVHWNTSLVIPGTGEWDSISVIHPFMQ